MDILKLLLESTEDLCSEDLDFFETELAVGDYDGAYRAACKSEIQALRTQLHRLAAPPLKKREPKPGASSGFPEPASREAPPAPVSPAQLVWDSIAVIREQDDYKKAFRRFVKDSPVIDSGFLDTHFSRFKSWGMGAILSLKPLDEAFLEKYFGALDHDKIARYQLFSERFFMKHFAQLNPDIVLAHGKNSWRVREQRSRQLDVFLRLKGIKL